MKSLLLLSQLFASLATAGRGGRLPSHHDGHEDSPYHQDHWTRPHDPDHSSVPLAEDYNCKVTYHGVYRDQIEYFLSIPFAQSTGGANRFAPPKPVVSSPGSSIYAQSPGPACPQSLGQGAAPLYLSNITEISEDCLHLNVARPNGTKAGDNLPVLVYIHGGSFNLGSKDEIVSQPGGMILESVANGLPIIHVAMNYRLGVFGFAQTGALEASQSENAGMRDWWAALQWVQQNIAYFGGDPDKVTISGQSSGGLAVSMLVMAYGASQPFPFHQAIWQSQAFDVGMTSNLTRGAMMNVTNASGCNTSDFDSDATIACLRNLTTQQLLDAYTEYYYADDSHNLGDLWLPVVDGDFLPAAPSTLIQEGKLANVTTIIGWCEDDANPFAPDLAGPDVTEADGVNFLRAFLPDLNATAFLGLLALYPTSDFPASPAANLTSHFYRATRILRDIIFVCSPIYIGQAIANDNHNTGYIYVQNQSMVTPILESLGAFGLGVVHTSEFAYVYGNLSHYNLTQFPDTFHPSGSDYDLQHHESRSWSTFTSLGYPSLEGHETLPGWQSAAYDSDNIELYVVGGPDPGLSTEDGSGAKPAIEAQKLGQRCSFLNSPEIIAQLRY